MVYKPTRIQFKKSLLRRYLKEYDGRNYRVPPRRANVTKEHDDYTYNEMREYFNRAYKNKEDRIETAEKMLLDTYALFVLETETDNMKIYKSGGRKFEKDRV